MVESSCGPWHIFFVFQQWTKLCLGGGAVLGSAWRPPGGPGKGSSDTPLYASEAPFLLFVHPLGADERIYADVDSAGFSPAKRYLSRFKGVAAFQGDILMPFRSL